MSYLLLVEQAAPATPSANQVVLYPKADGLMYSKDDTGTESAIASGVAAAKFLVMWVGTGTTILFSFNVTSVTNTGTGDELVTIATDFSSITWAGFVSSNAPMNEILTNVAAGTVQIVTRNSAGAVTDATDNVCGFGNQ